MYQFLLYSSTCALQDLLHASPWLCAMELLTSSSEQFLVCLEKSHPLHLPLYMHNILFALICGNQDAHTSVQSLLSQSTNPVLQTCFNLAFSGSRTPCSLHFASMHPFLVVHSWTTLALQKVLLARLLTGCTDWGCKGSVGIRGSLWLPQPIHNCPFLSQLRFKYFIANIICFVCVYVCVFHCKGIKIYNMNSESS